MEGITENRARSLFWEYQRELCPEKFCPICKKDFPMQKIESFDEEGNFATYFRCPLCQTLFTEQLKQVEGELVKGKRLVC